jgi:hypothetical protein
MEIDQNKLECMRGLHGYIRSFQTHVGLKLLCKATLSRASEMYTGLKAAVHRVGNAF